MRSGFYIIEQLIIELTLDSRVTAATNMKPNDISVQVNDTAAMMKQTQH